MSITKMLLLLWYGTWATAKKNNTLSEICASGFLLLVLDFHCKKIKIRCYASLLNSSCKGKSATVVAEVICVHQNIIVTVELSLSLL